MFDGGGTGAGVEEPGDGNAGDESFEGVDSGVVKSGGTGEAVAVRSFAEG